MNLRELKALLALHPEALPQFILPDGDTIPAHFHITEVGHVAKRFIDCGGTLHDTTDTCLLQTWVADDVDHRLDGRTLAKILQLGDRVLPHDDLRVEVEYEDCAVTQFPLTSAVFADGSIQLQLGEKHTDCLAKEKCGIAVGDSCCGGGEAVDGESVDVPQAASCC